MSVQPADVWPRKLTNFPIILLAIVQQYTAALALMIDANVYMTTNLHILYEIIPKHNIIVLLLIAIPSAAMLGFRANKKVTTLLCLVPQQLLLYLSAGAGLEAIIFGQYADHTTRGAAFIAADQTLTICLAFFHTWAMLLIMRYSADKSP